MVGMDKMMPEGPAPAAGSSWLRRVVSTSIAALVMGSSLYVGARRSFLDLTFIFRDASPRALPPTHVTQVEIVKKRVPKGSVVIYFMEQREVWQFGLWKRSLYPDYVLIPVTGSAVLGSPEFEALRRRYQVRYVLLAGASLSRVSRNIALPDYPVGIPIALAELEN
jgi:hypothetical protein